MFGELINRCLLMLFGYAYPAFECYKTLEKNSRSFNVEELRFWCKYWIIVAVFTVAERFADFLIAWLPVYGEMKLAFLIYLWHPKIKGSELVYGRILQPYLVKNEGEIERALVELKVRAWDLGFGLWRNCSELGLSSFFKALNYAADLHPTKSSSLQREDHQDSTVSPPPPNDSPSSEPQSGEETITSSRIKAPSIAGINRIGSKTWRSDGEQSPRIDEPESVCDEEDRPASPYPRSRLRRVKPLS